jgi:hypothetical protein
VAEAAAGVVALAGALAAVLVRLVFASSTDE